MYLLIVLLLFYILADAVMAWLINKMSALPNTSY